MATTILNQKCVTIHASKLEFKNEKEHVEFSNPDNIL